MGRFDGQNRRPARRDRDRGRHRRPGRRQPRRAARQARRRPGEEHGRKIPLQLALHLRHVPHQFHRRGSGRGCPRRQDRSLHRWPCAQGSGARHRQGRPPADAVAQERGHRSRRSRRLPDQRACPAMARRVWPHLAGICRRRCAGAARGKPAAAAGSDSARDARPRARRLLRAASRSRRTRPKAPPDSMHHPSSSPTAASRPAST